MKTNLVVYYKNKPVYGISEYLLNKQKAWHNLEAIKEKHVEKLSVYEEMNNTDDRDLLYLFDKFLMLIEFELQELWGFEQNAKYHRFWEYPKCLCAKTDNNDSYPHFMYISLNCPLHGV